MSEDANGLLIVSCHRWARYCVAICRDSCDGQTATPCRKWCETKASPGQMVGNNNPAEALHDVMEKD